MQAQLTVRLPEDLSDDVASAARRLKLKRSDIVRLALEKFLDESMPGTEHKPYDKVRHLLGSLSSGINDLGESHREHILKRLKQRA